MKIIFLPLDRIGDNGGYHLLLASVTLNGIPAKMLVDTGAMMSIVDSSFYAKHLTDCPLGDSFKVANAKNIVETPSLKNISLKAEGIEVNLPIMLINDISHLMQGLDYPNIDGMLGLDALYMLNASLRVVQPAQLEMIITTDVEETEEV